jgi:hypothetical protein
MNRLVAVGLAVIVLAGCTPATQPTPTPISIGTVTPLAPIPGTSELGLSLATLSVRGRNHLTNFTDTGVTVVEPESDVSRELRIVHHSWDGARLWDATVTSPRPDAKLVPHMSYDDQLDAVAYWYSRGEKDRTPIGDIHWFRGTTGRAGTITPPKSARVEVLGHMIGYYTYTKETGTDRADSWTILGPSLKPLQQTWDNVMREDDANATLSGFYRGRPLILAEAVGEQRLQFGTTEYARSFDPEALRVHTNEDSVTMITHTDGSPVRILGPTGAVILQKPPACEYATESRGSEGISATHAWTGALVFDLRTHTSTCLKGIFDLDDAGISSVLDDGTAIVVSGDKEPYTTSLLRPGTTKLQRTALTEVPGVRGQHLTFTPEASGILTITAFCAKDLRL